MSDSYLQRVTACEHGEWNPHATGEPLLNEDNSLNYDNLCRGATLRPVVVRYDKAEAELRRARPEWTPFVGDPFVIRNVVDAALMADTVAGPEEETSG